MENDTRNLVDEYKGMTNEQVFKALSKKRNELEIAIENVEHDFNIGTIVRNANSFNARRVHIIGRKKKGHKPAWLILTQYLEVEILVQQANLDIITLQIYVLVISSKCGNICSSAF